MNREKITLKPILNITKYFELIKFSHTVFALPFALISSILATRELQLTYLSVKTLELFAWIILAMVGARSGAMGFNRLIDAKWDAENPRTATRPSVTGEIGRISMLIMILISFSLLVISAWNLNSLAFRLSPFAIFLVCFYSYTKRFTNYSHLFLGIAIGSAPVAGWIAISGSISVSSLIIGLSVLTWIAGFDILYALQDLEYDKTAGLHSIPVKFGIGRSLRMAKLMHFITILCWCFLAYRESLALIFYTGILISSFLLIWEHRLLKEDDLSKLNIAFFNMNAVISVTMFVALIADILVFS
ncbi:putative 4-hydroxybenzoate polyprenyltransferase [bacterium]|nr:putative 4-hydroxybenzoate polyprenyltransferase [bacterium]